MKINVRVLITDVFSKEFEAETITEAREMAEAETWSPDHGWRHENDMGSAEILDIRVVVPPVV